MHVHGYWTIGPFKYSKQQGLIAPLLWTIPFRDDVIVLFCWEQKSTSRVHLFNEAAQLTVNYRAAELPTTSLSWRVFQTASINDLFLYYS